MGKLAPPGERGLGRLAGIHPRDVIAAFRRLGWEEVRMGKHRIMKKAGHQNVLSIPYHARPGVKEGLLRSQVKAAGISVDEFLEALRKGS